MSSLFGLSVPSECKAWSLTTINTHKEQPVADQGRLLGQSPIGSHQTSFYGAAGKSTNHNGTYRIPLQNCRNDECSFLPLPDPVIQPLTPLRNHDHNPRNPSSSITTHPTLPLLTLLTAPPPSLARHPRHRQLEPLDLLHPLPAHRLPRHASLQLHRLQHLDRQLNRLQHLLWPSATGIVSTDVLGLGFSGDAGRQRDGSAPTTTSSTSRTCSPRSCSPSTSTTCATTQTAMPDRCSSSREAGTRRGRSVGFDGVAFRRRGSCAARGRGRERRHGASLISLPVDVADRLYDSLPAAFLVLGQLTYAVYRNARMGARGKDRTASG